MNQVRKDIHSKLISISEDIKNIHISELHDLNLSQRVVKHNLLDFDFSKQRIDDNVLDYLFQIPDQINLRNSLRALFDGEATNPSEERLVSHTLYRNKISVEDFNLIFTERERIKIFLEQEILSSSFKNVICLSIGGSRLGPELLSEFQSLDGPLKTYFCSSYDLLELTDVLKNCEQHETLVFVSSKSFETSEILKNLDFLKSWFKKNPDIVIQDHLYGISANSHAMSSCGIKKSNQFLLLDSLGGRFSIWSSISLPAFINSDFSSYLEFLEGAYLADQHTNSTPWESNISVIMALLSIWNTNALNINNHGIFTYNFRLRSLTDYIAQMSMESNGKSINFALEKSPFSTSPLVWGGYGIESQHSTFQWLMQGKTETSCDFIGVNDGKKETIDSYEMLLSQVLAMSHGKEDKQNPYKSVKGNNPCSILKLTSLDLKSLGFLLAIYEHKVFIEALILGVDPFDQWGVQLGKRFALETKSNKEFLKDYFSEIFLPKS
jgi:glucose-6-phosphate isomerase